MKGYLNILECSDGIYYTGSTINLENSKRDVLNGLAECKNEHLLIIGFVWPDPNSSAAGSRMMQLIYMGYPLSAYAFYQ